MSWLSKATGIHIGGSLGISKTLDNAYGNTYGRIVSGISRFGEGAMAMVNTGPKIEEQKKNEADAIAAARKAAHDAEVADLAQGSLGAISLRKRRGGYATMLTGSPMMGTSPGSTGKTMLSQ